MNDFFWIVPTILVIAAVSYAVYAFSTRGFKGALFGHKIAASDENRVEYRHRGSKHTIRIHRLGDNDLYGLEIGIWAAVFGETSAIVIPREELLQLRDRITEFVESEVRV